MIFGGFIPFSSQKGVGRNKDEFEELEKSLDSIFGGYRREEERNKPEYEKFFNVPDQEKHVPLEWKISGPIERV